MIPPFQTTFAVPMHCESCVEEVSSAVHKLAGITTIAASLATQTLTITGTAAPSTIVTTIQSTGRDAILRGSGSSNSAAVSILEIPTPPSSSPPSSSVRGLARLVQVSPTHTLIDLTLRGLPPGTYDASIRERGDISGGVASTGAVWRGGRAAGAGQKETCRGMLGEVRVTGDGSGSAFLQHEGAVWEVIGRGMVVEASEGEGTGEAVVGVIARSAGVWENEKVVCSCSGKTVWEERGEQVERGML